MKDENLHEIKNQPIRIQTMKNIDDVLLEIKTLYLLLTTNKDSNNENENLTEINNLYPLLSTHQDSNNEK